MDRVSVKLAPAIGSVIERASPGPRHQMFRGNVTDVMDVAREAVHKCATSPTEVAKVLTWKG